MLVLSRKVGERMVIGDGIIVRVLQVRGKQIRLGIEAPPEVTIRRGELAVYQELQSVSAEKVTKLRSGMLIPSTAPGERSP